MKQARIANARQHPGIELATVVESIRFAMSLFALSSCTCPAYHLK
jgi:hypothetical protein